MLNLLRTGRYNVRRFAANSGYYQKDGTYIEPTNSESTFSIQANIQPFRDGKTKITLPDGVRSDDAITVFTETELFTDEELVNGRGDIITYRGLEYECYYLEPWVGYGNLLPEHYNCTFVKRDKLRRAISERQPDSQFT